MAYGYVQAGQENSFTWKRMKKGFDIQMPMIAQLLKEGKAICIFPEGTRAKDGVMKEFNVAGVMALARTAPSAIIVPVAIDGSWELMRYGMRPVPFGVRVKCTVLAPIAPDEFPIKELSGVIEGRIRAVVDAGRQSAPAPEVALSD